jgi:UDP-N-acetylglucosamine:LPS N-acetylglucosamine transferase
MQPPPAELQTKALLVCSPGGHLLQMLCLEPAWGDLRRTWVTLEAPDSEHLLEEERVVLAQGPTNRSLRALLANLRLAWRVVRRERPDVILSTGAALALPFFLVGKLFGARLIYVESLTRTGALSLTGRLVYPLADAFFVQWPGAAGPKRARFVGGLL